jgi:hypothetical protein
VDGKAVFSFGSLRQLVLPIFSGAAKKYPFCKDSFKGTVIGINKILGWEGAE